MKNLVVTAVRQFFSKPSFILATPLPWLALISVLASINFANAQTANAVGQQLVEIQSMTVDELNRFNKEIVEKTPNGKCLAWVFFDGPGVKTPIAIYDELNRTSIFKANDIFIPSVGGSVNHGYSLRKKQPEDMHLGQRLVPVTSFFNQYYSNNSLIEGQKGFGLQANNLSIKDKKMQCTFAKAYCRQYVGDFSLTVAEFKRGESHVIVKQPPLRLLIEDMCPVSRPSPTAYDSTLDPQGLVEVSETGRMSHSQYTNDVARYGIRQKVTLKEALK